VGNTDLNAERVDYVVNLPVAGTWYFWARGRSPGALGNSCHIGIDGDRPTTGQNIGNAGQWNGANWQWDFVRNNNTANAAQITVAAAGIHTFHIWAREDGLQIDKILLIPVAGNPPGTGISRGATTLGPAATPRNQCPTPRITTIALCTELETNTFISPNGSNACFVLDGSLSSDPDGDALTYLWFLDGEVVPIAVGVRTTNCLDAGEHTITLVVDDGRCVCSASVTVDVLTGCEAVEDLIAKVNDASLTRPTKRPLIATLKAACASFERGSFESAMGQLGAFINKVHAQIEPANPDEAALFIRCAQSILDSVNCEEAGASVGPGPPDSE
jgi:hypothetical protein